MNPGQHILLALVRLYRMVISPALGAFFGPAGGCRFTPTCSVYAADAVREHGAVCGSWLATKRLCRCHPWGGCGHDPVPENFGSECARPRAQQREQTDGDRKTRGPTHCRIAVPGDGHTPHKTVSAVSEIFQTSYKTQPLAASSSTVI